MEHPTSTTPSSLHFRTLVHLPKSSLEASQEDCAFDGGALRCLPIWHPFLSELLFTSHKQRHSRRQNVIRVVPGICINTFFTASNKVSQFLFWNHHNSKSMPHRQNGKPNHLSRVYIFVLVKLLLLRTTTVLCLFTSQTTQGGSPVPAREGVPWFTASKLSVSSQSLLQGCAVFPHVSAPMDHFHFPLRSAKWQRRSRPKWPIYTTNRRSLILPLHSCSCASFVSEEPLFHPRAADSPPYRESPDMRMHFCTYACIL